MIAQPLPTPTAPAAILALSKAFADPLRLDVLRLLQNNSFGVMELCHITTTPQSGMSHHLKILTGCGLLETKREGTSIFYRRAMLPQNGFLSDLTKTFLETLDQTALSPELLKTRQEIYDDRSQQSADFFKRCAAQLKENQDLVASFEHYSGCVGDLIGNENLPRETRVIEIGAGESPLLTSLSSTFKSVLVVDNSAEMLKKTKARVQARTAQERSLHAARLRHPDPRFPGGPIGLQHGAPSLTGASRLFSKSSWTHQAKGQAAVN